jgi:sugar phosphate isomerase/epimerase
MSNTLAFQLYSLKDYEDGFEAALEVVKSIGVDTIEVWSGAVPDDRESEASVDDLRRILTAAGMKLTCGHVSIDEFDSRYDEWTRLLLDNGSTSWVIPFAKADSLDEWLAHLPKFREMASRLSQDGLSLGYHNHHMELERFGDKHVMEHLLDNMPELFAQFHIGQFKPSRGVDLPDWIRKYEGRVVSLHLNDATDDDWAPLGQGSCKAAESIRAALDTGVDTYIVEVGLVRDTIDAVKRDVAFAQELIR